MTERQIFYLSGGRRSREREGVRRYREDIEVIINDKTARAVSQREKETADEEKTPVMIVVMGRQLHTVH